VAAREAAANFLTPLAARLGRLATVFLTTLPTAVPTAFLAGFPAPLAALLTVVLVAFRAAFLGSTLAPADFPADFPDFPTDVAADFPKDFLFVVALALAPEDLRGLPALGRRMEELDELAERAAGFRLIVARLVPARRLVFRFAMVICPFEP
jgi:hypothetical protein